MARYVNLRLDIERQLIACILYLDAFGRLCHIVSEKNFSENSSFHRNVYRTCQQLYPKKAINIFTVWQAISLNSKDKEEYFGLFEYCNYLTARHEQELALMLLQLDLKEKFSALIQTKSSEANRNFEHEKEGILKEMYQTLHSSTDDDLLSMINICEKYFAEKFPDDLDFKTFEDQLRQKIQNIKKRQQINNLIYELYNHSNTQSEQIKKACQTFADAITQTINSQNINQKIQNALNALNP